MYIVTDLRSFTIPTGLLIACFVAFTGCGDVGDLGGAESDDAGTNVEPAKEDDLEVEAPLDLGSDVETVDLPMNRAVSVGRGDYSTIYRFRKESGVRYTVTLGAMNADLDLYGHYEPSVRRGEHHLYSLRSGTQVDSFEFTATQEGWYYVVVYGYERGRGALSVTAENGSLPGSQPCGEVYACQYVDRVFVAGYGACVILDENPAGYARTVVTVSGRNTCASGSTYGDSTMHADYLGRAVACPSFETGRFRWSQCCPYGSCDI